MEGIVAYFISSPLYRAINSLYTLHESIQACAVTATSIFNHATTWNGQLHASSGSPPGKEPSVPTEYETGWAPERVWTSCEEFYTVTDRTGLWVHISTVQQKRTLTLSRRKKSQSTILNNAPPFLKEDWLLFLERSQPSPVCPQGHSNVCATLAEWHLQRETEVPGEKPVSVA